jgi:hypothetical protein
MPLSHVNVSGTEVELSDYLTILGVILEYYTLPSSTIKSLTTVNDLFIFALSVISDPVLP